MRPVPAGVVTRKVAALVAVAGVALAMLAFVPASAQPSESSKEAHSDPWPTGNEWPVDQAGPFSYQPIHQTVTMDDGVVLDGWIWLPELPGDLRSPTVLFFSPYNGNVDPPANDPTTYGPPRFVVPAERLASEGYAVAFFSIRGTGNSGGCYDWVGRRVARDGAQLVEWLGSRPWSNGRVGMIGVSEDATVAWATASQNPPSLKTIIATSGVADRWTSYTGTPNGLLSAYTPINEPANYAFTGMTPPAYVSPQGSPQTDVESTRRAIERDRLCEDVKEDIATQVNDWHADVRDESFWSERRYTDAFPDIEAAVLATSGYADTTVIGFGAEAIGWELLEAPKAMIHGQWGHASPSGLPQGEWHDVVIDWFDFWLKGLGHPPSLLGQVQYQTDDLDWAETSSWPPAEANEEVLYLSRHDLRSDPDGSSRSFSSVVEPGGAVTGAGYDSPLCAPGVSLLYESAPVAADTVIAGSPFAYLRLSSTQDGGQVGVNVYELESTFSCETNPTAYKTMTFGIADLRYHDGSFEATPFPRRPTNVRIDLEAIAQRIEAGNRIGVLINAGDATFRAPSNYTPTIAVHSDGDRLASQIVLPVVDDQATVAEETLGAGKPKAKYPPRPNLPN